MTTLAPRLSSSRAVALPMPPLPPVIRTTFPSRSKEVLLMRHRAAA